MSDKTAIDMKALGALGGEAKARNRANAANDAAVNLPPLDSTQHAKDRLEIISSLAVAGVLPGSQAGAAVRAVEVWLKVEAHEMDRRRIKELEEQIELLRKQLATSSGLRRVG